jgi:hypothetical protein
MKGEEEKGRKAGGSSRQAESDVDAKLRSRLDATALWIGRGTGDWKDTRCSAQGTKTDWVPYRQWRPEGYRDFVAFRGLLVLVRSLDSWRRQRACLITAQQKKKKNNSSRRRRISLYGEETTGMIRRARKLAGPREQRSRKVGRLADLKAMSTLRSCRTQASLASLDKRGGLCGSECLFESSSVFPTSRIDAILEIAAAGDEEGVTAASSAFGRCISASITARWRASAATFVDP